MSQVIKIDIETAKREADRLALAIETFEPFTQSFTKEAADELHDFNSDFVEKLKDVLRNMADDTGPELLQEIKEYHEKLVATIKTLEKMDESIATNIKTEG